MKLEHLKQKAQAAKEFEEAQTKGRLNADAESDKKRGEFRVSQQQEQTLGALEQLRQSKQRIEEVRKQVEGFVAQAAELQQQKGGKQQRLAEIYGKINEMLKDPDIRKELQGMGKAIENAEHLVADADFAEEAGVSEALEIQTTLVEIENQLVALEQDERRLHTEIAGGDNANESKNLRQIRQEAGKALEEQTRQLDEQIGILELHTPEGQQKAERDLAAKLDRGGDIHYDIRMRDRMTDSLLSERLVNGDILQVRDTIGEEKFTQIVREGYAKRLDAYAEAHKKQAGLDTWDRDFKIIENYPKQAQEASNNLRQLYEQRKNISTQLEQFLLSSEGRPVLEQLVRQRVTDEFWNRAYQGRAGLDRSKEQPKLDEELKAVTGEIDKNPQWYANTYGRHLLDQLEALATDYVNNSAPNRELRHTAILQSLSEKIESGNRSLYQKEYEKLPDMQGVQAGLGEAQAFYQRILEKLQDPQSLPRIVTTTHAAEGYLYSNRASFGGGLKSELERPYNNSYWGRMADDYNESQQAIKDFTALMPQYDGRKLGAVTFETPDFNKKSDYGYNRNEYVRDRAKQQLDELAKYVDTLRPIVQQKADYDVATVGVAEFERSSKFPETKAHGDIHKKQENLKTRLSEIIDLQKTVGANREITLGESRHSRESSVSISDTESEKLYERQNQLQREIGQKKEELYRLENQGRPGLLSGKRGAWDSSTAQLRAEIPKLEDEVKANAQTLTNLRSVREGLFKLGKILAEAAQDTPESYRRLNFGEAKTAGQIYEKLNQLTQEVTGMKSTPDQREFAKDYTELQEQIKKMRDSLEQATAAIGIRRSF